MRASRFDPPHDPALSVPPHQPVSPDRTPEAMEEQDENTQRRRPEQQKEAPRKPRGLGGVVLIMLLLLALFVMVSKASFEQPFSLYDFYRVLLNGDVEHLEWQDNGDKALVSFRRHD